MSAVIFASVKPPSVDDLDFWGALDDLLWSLDDPVWDAAGIYFLRIRETGKASQRLRAANEIVTYARSHVAAKGVLGNVVYRRAGCRGGAGSAETLHAGYVTGRMHCHGLAGGCLRPWVDMYGAAETVAVSSELCTGALRGHGWIQVAPTAAQWVSRQA